MIVNSNDKNPYAPETPEWQLFENLIGAMRLERSHIADAKRYQELAAAAREKAAKFIAALDKLKD